MTELILADPMPPLFAELAGDRFNVRPLENASASDLDAAVGIVAYSHPCIDREVMDRCPELKVISNHGVGVDHIDVGAARQRNIPVGNTPGCLDASTADMTLALMLSVARNVVTGDHFARSAAFTHYDPAVLIGQEVTGSTLGIVGMGRIGAEVARRARAFDMRVLYFNRNPRPEIAQFNFGALSASQAASTRIRLAKTQDLLAIAKMQDGTWAAVFGNGYNDTGSGESTLFDSAEPLWYSSGPGKLIGWVEKPPASIWST